MTPLIPSMPEYGYHRKTSSKTLRTERWGKRLKKPLDFLCFSLQAISVLAVIGGAAVTMAFA